jgi:hypothetical protein
MEPLKPAAHCAAYMGSNFMTRLLKTASLVALLTAPSLALAGNHDQAIGRQDPNWGKATKDAISDGFDQGGHSSDPSGDGHGPGTADEPRSGLANVVNQGDLGATLDLILSVLGGD